MVALAWLAAGSARADGPYEGQWREGPMSVRVQVESWGGDCGPQPRSTTAAGGGTFRISQSGDHLTFHLRRPRTTRSCWSENRAVRRVSSTHQAGTWRIVCRTPPADSRAEAGTYTIRAIGDDRLQFRDESRYDWQLNESSCRARIVTTLTFTRVSGGERPSEPPTSEPSRPARCTPGDPARVVLRPTAAEIEPGGEQCFTARVVDEGGCTVRRATLAVADGDPGRIDGRCYRADGAEGEARVVASAGQLRAEARVSIHPMDLSDLIARRTETGSVGSGAPEEDARAETAARVSAREADEGPSLLWPALALAAALLLVGGALVLLRRRSGGPAEPRKKGIGGLPGIDVPEPEPAETRPAEPPPAEPQPGAPGGAAEAGDEPPAEATGEDRICPTCRRGYPPGTARCPHDDTELMSYRDFAAGKGPGGAARENVCPVCGARFPATVKFCGKDGATLEPAEP
jgi:hypothetical protein